MRLSESFEGQNNYDSWSLIFAENSNLQKCVKYSEWHTLFVIFIRQYKFPRMYLSSIGLLSNSLLRSKIVFNFSNLDS